MRHAKKLESITHAQDKAGNRPKRAQIPLNAKLSIKVQIKEFKNALNI